MSTITQINLIVLICFILPFAIYYICSMVFKKPFLNVPIFIVLFLICAVWQIFGYEIKSGSEINIIEGIRSFFHNDSSMVVAFMWMPSITGALIVNIISVIKHIKSK